MATQLTKEQIEAINDAVFAGRKIQAIRLYRAATRLGLKEAKEFIDALESRLREESPELFREPQAAGCSRSAALLIVATAAVYAAARLLVG
jgi:ribosomal protein L7/L12